MTCITQFLSRSILICKETICNATLKDLCRLLGRISDASNDINLFRLSFSLSVLGSQTQCVFVYIYNWIKNPLSCALHSTTFECRIKHNFASARTICLVERSTICYIHPFPSMYSSLILNHLHQMSIM